MWDASKKVEQSVQKERSDFWCSKRTESSARAGTGPEEKRRPEMFITGMSFGRTPDPGQAWGGLRRSAKFGMTPTSTCGGPQAQRESLLPHLSLFSARCCAARLPHTVRVPPEPEPPCARNRATHAAQDDVSRDSGPHRDCRRLAPPVPRKTGLPRGRNRGHRHPSPAAFDVRQRCSDPSLRVPTGQLAQTGVSAI